MRVILAVVSLLLPVIAAAWDAAETANGTRVALRGGGAAFVQRRPDLYRQHSYEYLEGKGMCVGVIVAHEGDQKPLQIGSRPSLQKRGGHTLADNTKDLGWMIWEELHALGTGSARSKYPFYLKNRIDRSYVDMNRSPKKCPGYDCPSKAGELAYHPSSKDAAQAFKYFHQKAETMRKSLARKCNRGALLIDVHGQQRTQRWAQVGYGVSAAAIERPGDLVDQLVANRRGWGGTINGLYGRQRKGRDEAFATSLVMGRRSFSKILNGLRGSSSLRVRAGPSQGSKVGSTRLDKPTKYPKKYLTGGFIVQRYGSCTCCTAKQRMRLCKNDRTNTQPSSHRNVDAVQLEFPTSAMSKRSQRRAIAKQVAATVKKFFAVNGKQPLFY